MREERCSVLSATRSSSVHWGANSKAFDIAYKIEDVFREEREKGRIRMRE